MTGAADPLATLEAARFLAMLFAAPLPWRHVAGAPVALPGGVAPGQPQPVGLDFDRVAALARGAGAPEAVALDWAGAAELGALKGDRDNG